jgi:UDP-N-acetylglucosamine transferase subunit ALG13
VIVVTVGMQLGFDRLIEAMDRLAPDLGVPVIAQTGKGRYVPKNMEKREKIAPSEFEALVEQAEVIVSHAGIGSMLTAARVGKPIVLMPRRANLKEHRNDHQMATARKFAGRPGILIAYDESELAERIAQARALGELPPQQAPASRQLHEALARFIEDGTA